MPSLPIRATTRRLLLALSTAAALSLAGCATEPLTAPAPGAEGVQVEAPEQVDAEGVASFSIGEATSFEVFPTLEKGNVARITINSADYTTGVDFEQYKPREPITADGLLIINLTWETLEGRTQFNSGYVVVTVADGSEAVRLWENLEGSTKNGGVDIGEPHTGNMAFAIDRGDITITITNHEFGDALTMKLTV